MSRESMIESIKQFSVCHDMSLTDTCAWLSQRKATTAMQLCGIDGKHSNDFTRLLADKAWQREDAKTMTKITMTKDEYLAERLAGKNRAQIANDLGLKHQAYLYPQLEKWGIKDKEDEHAAMAEISGIEKPKVTTTVVPKVEPNTQTVVEHIVPTIVFTEPKVNVLDRLDALRNKFAECISELTEIEKEVRPLLEAKSEMSQVAKKLLELVG